MSVFSGEVHLKLPPPAMNFDALSAQQAFASSLTSASVGHNLAMIADHKQLTTHQAGKFLGVSRRYLCRRLIWIPLRNARGRRRGAGWRASKMGSLSETGGKR